MFPMTVVLLMNWPNIVLVSTGYNIHTMSLPNVMLWGLSLFNKNAKTFLPVVGKQSQFDNTRVSDDFYFSDLKSLFLLAMFS